MHHRPTSSLVDFSSALTARVLLDDSLDIKCRLYCPIVLDLIRTEGFVAASEFGQRKHQFLVQDQHPIDVTFCGPGMDIRARITHGMREARL